MPILGVIAASWKGPGAYDSIATATVGSGGSTIITFDNIPSTYAHLQIRAIARRTGSGTTGATDFLRFNSDSGANYTWHYLQYSAAVGAGAFTGQAQAYSLLISEGGSTSNTFAATIIDILDYTNTNKNTTIRTFGGYELNAADSKVQVSSSLWLNTAAVTRIDLDTGANDFAQYSHFALYGIRGA